MLADALNPPEIGQFDFIYDRACYHEVRGQNLAAYLETLRKVSRPGTRMLLLAGNSNGPDLGFGPPTVSEEDLRFDFTPLFDFEWLRESRFEVYPATAGFPLAWSALMRRKAE
jgi:SAM-dependent methyltransferase